MTDQPWTDLGPASDFPRDSQHCLRAQGVPLVVINVADEFYALKNICPHAGRPLGDGERAGMTLTCPYHGYTYHIKTGKNIDFPEDEAPVRTFPIRVYDGRVQALLTTEKDA